MTFEELIAGFPTVRKGYESAVSEAVELGLEGNEFYYFLSKNCRAFFFYHHLKVEREAGDDEIRDINQSAIVPFELTAVQLGLLNRFEARMQVGKKFRQRIMKCRRAQVSTIFLAIGYHIIRFNDNKKGLCFCDRLETSRKLRRILEIFYSNDDLINKPTIGKKTLCEGLYLHPFNSDKGKSDRDSFILLGSGEQSNSGIGGSLDFMHWSEAALTKDADTHWTTISPSLKGALFDVAESTPSLTGQDAIIFKEFENPSDNCDIKFISWLDIKEYKISDPDKIAGFSPYVDHHLYGKEAEIMTEYKVSVEQMLWRRFKLDEIKDANAFRQVFPISEQEAFYSGAGIFFHKDLIELVKPAKPRDYKTYLFSDQGVEVSGMLDDSGPWKVYDLRYPDFNYLISCDIAEGKCADKEQRDPDYSVAMVYKLGRPVEEVAFFRERIPPEIFAEQVSVAARYYNNAMVIPERNGPGLAFMIRLLQLYNNVYKQQKLQAGTYVMTQDYGFQTTSPSKIHALSCLQKMMREGQLRVSSDIVYKEMAKYVQVGMKYGAMSGYHDDTISCLFLMAICLEQTPTLLMPSQVLNGQPLSNVRHIENIIKRDSWAYSK